MIPLISALFADEDGKMKLALTGNSTVMKCSSCGHDALKKANVHRLARPLVVAGQFIAIPAILFFFAGLALIAYGVLKSSPSGDNLAYDFFGIGVGLPAIMMSTPLFFIHTILCMKKKALRCDNCHTVDSSS